MEEERVIVPTTTVGVQSEFYEEYGDHSIVVFIKEQVLDDYFKQKFSVFKNSVKKRV